MIENLLNLIKKSSQDNVVDNPQIPNEHNDAVVAEATHAVAGGLQDALANGQGAELLSMFNSKSSAEIMSSPVAQQIQGGFLENITSKLGINKNVAIGLAGTLIPIVISKLVKRTNDTSNNSFDLNSIISSLTGGNNAGNGGIGGLLNQFTQSGTTNSGGIGDLISQFTGGSNTSNTGGGIGDLISQFTGGAKTQQAQQGSNGLMDMIKGFMGGK